MTLGQPFNFNFNCYIAVEIKIKCHNVAKSSQMNLLNMNGDIVIRFEMSKLQIKVNSPILPILTLKLVAMATSHEPAERGDQIGNLRPNQIPTI